MSIDDFILKREDLFSRVCYRLYKCINDYTLIIVNLNTDTTAILDGLSALFFSVLAAGSVNDIRGFASDNDINNNDIEDFIEELLVNEIIGVTINDKNKTIGDVEKPQIDRELVEFQEKLFQNGYLYAVHLDITYLCNLKCIHCYHPFEEYEKLSEISFDSIVTFIDDLYNLGTMSITLSGGEVLLREDFWKIIEYISEKGMIITIFTNGTLLKKTDFEKINMYNIQKIGVSLYSIDEDIHDSITQVKGSCNSTKNSLEELKKTSVMIEVKCVMMNNNFNGYKKLRKYCKEKGFSLVLDTSMTPRLNKDKEPLKLGMTKEQIIEFSLDNELNYYIENNKELDWENGPCTAGRSSLYCDPSGVIYPCVSLRIRLGDMRNIKNIWEKSELLKQWQNTKIKDIVDCGKKDYCKYCVEVCAGICLLENGDYHIGNTSNCAKAKARQEAYIRLSKIRG